MGKKLSVFFLFIFLFCFLFISGYASQGIIPANVYLEGVDIGGLTIQDAHKKVREHLNRISFCYQNFSCSLLPEELGIRIDYESSFRELDNSKVWQKIAMNFQESYLSLKKSYDLEVMREVIKVVNNGVSIPPQNAGFEVADGNIVTKPGARGTKIEEEILIKNITKDPLQNKYIIPIVVVEPIVTEKDLESYKPTTLLAEYTTQFVKNANRTENIKLACEAIKNTLIAPGEVFSFNNIVGPRETERGYLNAMIIMGGQFAPGLGGGICQVSSTLYNTVLLANLEIIERHPHSLRIDYVPLGKDATVTYGVKDLKFKNNTPGYLLVDYKIIGQKLTISIFGTNEWVEKATH